MSLTPVLIVSYYFPPHGGAGTQRFAKFAKWLPKFGYRAVVVAAEAQAKLGSAPNGDPTLVDEVGAETVIYRVQSSGPALPLMKRVGLAAKFRVDGEEWAESARETVLQAGREQGVKAAVVTVSPYANWALGPVIREGLGVPWALDLRDPWSFDPWRNFPTWFHMQRDIGVMKKALRSPDMVIASTPAARRAFIGLAGLDQERVVTIPNGFDPEDFPSVRPPSSESFTVIHVGTLHGVSPKSKRLRHMLRASMIKSDLTARSGRYLFEAAAKLKKARPDLFEHLRIELVGVVDPSHRELAERLGISGAVVERGYLSHKDAVRAMCAADAVLVPLHANPEGVEELIAPGKLYEAVASGTFVLGTLPDGDAARLIRGARAGSVTAPTDAATMAHELERLIEAWKRGNPERGITPGMVGAFERERLTERLAGVLDAIRGDRGRLRADDPWVETESMGVHTPGRERAAG